MEIGTATEEHLKEYVHIGSRAFAEEPWNQEWDETLLTKRYRDLLRDPQGVNYEALDGNTVIGALFGSCIQCENGILYLVHDVFVDPLYQGRGKGSELLRLAERDLYARGVATIQLDTKRSEKTVSFYEKNGFRESRSVALMMKDIEFDVIVGQIRGQLTGQYAQDMAFLDEAKAKYADLEYGAEIGYEVERIRCEAYPEEQAKAEEEETRRKAEAGQVLADAGDDMERGNYEAAAARCLEAIAKYEPLFYRNGFLEYFSFHSMFEAMKYAFAEEDETEFEQAYIPFDRLFACAGDAYSQMGRYEEAAEMFDRSLAWNPVSCEVIFAYAAALCKLQDWDGVCTMAKLALRFADRRQDIGEAYGVLAYGYRMLRDWQAAVACCMLSRAYQGAQAAEAELELIRTESGKDFAQWNEADMLGAAVRRQIPLGPNKAVLEAMSEMVDILTEEGDTEEARQYAAMLYDLTGDGE